MNPNNLDEIAAVGGSVKPGFIEHVFQFNDAAKAESLNITQYATLAILPIVAMNKAISKWMPEATSDKGSVEIAVEVVSQTTVMFLGMMMIHRIITYIPTYSKSPYEDLHPTNVILAVLMILLSLQTNLGEKITILVERVMDAWEGRTEKPKKKTRAQPPTAPSMEGVSAMPPVQQSPDFNAMHQYNPTPLVGAATPGDVEFEPVAASEAAFGAALGASW